MTLWAADGLYGQPRLHGQSPVVRYNGGAQAGHNVVTSDGRHHTFSQFGSGTFAGAATHLSWSMLVNPITIFSEEEHLRKIGVSDAFDRLTVDGRALITTPFHMATNRIREIRRNAGRHGSCGMGIGETMQDWLKYGDQVLFVRDLYDLDLAREKLQLVQKRKKEELAALLDQPPVSIQESTERNIILGAGGFGDVTELCLSYYKDFRDRARILSKDRCIEILRKPGAIIFEGAQGALLDQDFGFQPYTTWTDITFSNANSLLTEADINPFGALVESFGVTRAYATRHGAGPFVTEDSVLGNELFDEHNKEQTYQGSLRIGHFDVVATKFAISMLNRVDGIVLTHLDQAPSFRFCTGYATAGSQPDLFEYNGPVATRMRAGDLDHQDRLANALFSTLPIIGPYVPTADMVRSVGEAAGVKVVMTGHGPTANSFKDVR